MKELLIDHQYRIRQDLMKIRQSRSEHSEQNGYDPLRSDSHLYSNTFYNVLLPTSQVKPVIPVFFQNSIFRGVYDQLYEHGIVQNPDLLRHIVIKKQEEKRKKSQGKVRMLDLMTHSRILNFLDVEGCVVDYDDYRTVGQKTRDIDKGRKFICGDVFSNKLWNTLESLYPEPGSFDIILHHPFEMNEQLPMNLHLYNYLLSAAYYHLSIEDGILLSSLPAQMEWPEEHIIMDYLHYLNTVNGIQTFYHDYTMLLSKSEGAPETLLDLQEEYWNNLKV